MTGSGDDQLITQIKQYRLVRELGRGGMGTVYEAIDTRDGGRVALKVLHPWLDAEDRSFRDRFEREAHIAALLRSPYSVRLLDFGATNGRCFLVMEYVQGSTLADLIATGPLDPLRALRIAIDVARALEEAAARGIVHRDIKPSNILLTDDGRVKVTDFGIARHEGSAGITASGTFVGTAEFAAPEQVTGEADHRTDIYALGAVLYTMLTGHPPFSAPSPWEVLRLHQTARLPVAPLSHLPDAVANPVRRCLEKDPRDRYQEPAELAAALERAYASYAQLQAAPTVIQPPAEQPPVTAPPATFEAGGTPTLAAPTAAMPTEASTPTIRAAPTPAAPPSPAISAGEPPGAPPPPLSPRKRRGGLNPAWIAAGVSSAAVVILAGVLLLRGGDEGDRPPAETPTAFPTEPSGIDGSPEAIPSATVVAPTADLVVTRSVPSGNDSDLCDFQKGISICEPLVYAKNPVLAESWQYTAPNTWTFSLRKGVPFHDGTELTAADVVATFEELARTANNAIGVKAGATTALDDYTVRFVTTSSLGEDLLAEFDNVLIPKKGADRSKTPIGTGPLRFVEYQKLGRLVVARWELYRNQASVKTRSITFIYINDAALRAQELLAGHVDLIIGVDPTLSASLVQSGFIIETCDTLTIAHTSNVTGGCSSTGVRYKDFVKR